MNCLPRVLLVGGPDVDARLGIMDQLRSSFDICAAGSSPGLREKFLANGFRYSSYDLDRCVNPIGDLRATCQLTRIFRRQKPLIVHTFDTKPGVWGCMAARLVGVPVTIATVTGLGSLYSSDGVITRSVRAAYQFLQKIACGVSDLTVFQNHEDARFFINSKVVAPGKATVIPGSGVRTDVYSRGRVAAPELERVKKDLGIQAADMVVTMISRVIRSKGVLEFAAAARAICRVHPQARFVLVGGEDPESLDRLTAAELAELKQSVSWQGPRPDIPAVLAASDIFVLPSAYAEGIPRVLLEAASMGLPLIASDSPGCRDVVQEGQTGFLVPPRDLGAFADAIKRLLAHPDLRLRFGRSARERAVSQFDLTVIADQTLSLYRQLLSRKRRSSVTLPSYQVV